MRSQPVSNNGKTILQAVAKKIVLRFAKRISNDILTIEDGESTYIFGAPLDCGTQTEGLTSTVVVHDQRAYSQALLHRGTGLGKAFAHGWISTVDLTTTLRIIFRATHPETTHFRNLRKMTRPLFDGISRVRRSDKHRDKENIHAHYDLGNEFFSEFLDKSMMYSCALFEEPSYTLRQASEAKLKRICELLDLKSSDKVLELGTGWGGFAIYAAQHFGCHVTTTTISDEQYSYAKTQVHKLGLDETISVLSTDYREISGTYDKIVSIEMIEAVGWKQYQTFFAKCESLLNPDGVMAIQAITVKDEYFERTKRKSDFIKNLIFPGGCLPSIKALLHAMQSTTDFQLLKLDSIGQHYGETLRQWSSNLQNNEARLKQMGLDDYFLRLWMFYFSYCEAGFEERYISSEQAVFARMPSTPSREQQPLVATNPYEELTATG